MKVQNGTLTSAEVVRKLDISLRQLYFWELKGIVTPTTVTAGSREFKRYSNDDLETLRRVKEALDQGFTLKAASQKAKQMA